MSEPVKGTVISVAPDAWSKPEIGSHINRRSYGRAIEYVLEDDDGKMYAVTEDESAHTQINFCPFTGKEARVKCL